MLRSFLRSIGRPGTHGLERSRIRVTEQFNAATRTFTSPKNGLAREAPLTEPAREALVSLPIEGEFCFAPIRGAHWTPASRAYHWKAVRAAAGWTGSLYLATRHFAGWYMVNELELPSEDVAIALGHGRRRARAQAVRAS